MKTRVISAIVAAIIVVPLVLIGGWVFNLGVAVLAALGYLEIIKLKESHNNLPNIIRLFGFLALELVTLYNSNTYGLSYISIVSTLLLLLIPTIFIPKDKYTTRDALYLIGFIILIGSFLNILITIRKISIYLLIYLVLIAVITDTFAYIIGSLIGKHKLIPSVSPKKSIEGSVGGSLLGTIVATIFYVNMLKVDSNILIIVIMTLVLSILGQIGDLLFSKIKRENKIKDFSNIMPGHGGILDRFDSLSFIILGYTLISNILSLIK